jgi:hypothetical protein
LLYTNDNGSLYTLVYSSQVYQLPRKTEVAKFYLELCKEQAHQRVNITTKLSKVSWGFANLVVTELKAIRAVLDPKLKRRKKQNVLGPGQKLSVIYEMFHLSLFTLDPARPLYSHKQKLEWHFNMSVSYQCIADWFHKRWDHEGNLNKANIVPLDKWKAVNKLCNYKFVQKMCIFNDHSNTASWTRNMFGTRTYAKEFWKDPLIGKIPCIYVNGDFRKLYNIMATISPNPQKTHPMNYKIGKENGTSEAFIGFLMYLIAKCFLLHDEFLIMDNATIHSRGNA